MIKSFDICKMNEEEKEEKNNDQLYLEIVSECTQHFGNDDGTDGMRNSSIGKVCYSNW